MLRRSLAAGTSKLEVDEVIDDRYRVTGLLGRGGFGAVYTAEHTGTGQAIALKVMVVGDGGAPDVGAVRRFYKEAQVTAQLRHPNTVRVFDVGQTQTGALYIAMELLHGGTLEERFNALAAQGEVLGVRGGLDVAIPVLRSLAEAHRNDLVHRDLKPANIMLSEVVEEDEPLVKVLDFGIARTQDSSLTGQGTALGTPAYMSPEQCMGGAVDGRSDLYSLGVILYRSVTGRLPFEDRNPLTIMYKHAHAELEPVQTAARVPVSSSFAAIVHRAMAKQPGARFATAREMRSALELARSDTELEASDQTWQYLRSVSPAGSVSVAPLAAGGVVPETPAADSLATAALGMGLSEGALGGGGPPVASGDTGGTGDKGDKGSAGPRSGDTAMVVSPPHAPTEAIALPAQRSRGPMLLAALLLLAGGGALAFALATSDGDPGEAGETRGTTPHAAAASPVAGGGSDAGAPAAPDAAAADAHAAAGSASDAGAADASPADTTHDDARQDAAGAPALQADAGAVQPGAAPPIQRGARKAARRARRAERQAAKKASRRAARAAQEAREAAERAARQAAAKRAAAKQAAAKKAAAKQAAAKKGPKPTAPKPAKPVVLD